MKKTISIFIVSFCISVIAFGQTNKRDSISFPEAKGYINDFENLFSNDEERTLDSLVTDFESRTQIEIAIVTIDSSMTSKDNFYKYTFDLANYWGVGKKELDNGILIGISSSLRNIRVQNGYGIEKILSDEETKKLIDHYFIPYFKKGDFFGGTWIGTIEIMKKVQ